jgi:putative spermidine/putrescine transport system permease protein
VIDRLGQPVGLGGWVLRAAAGLVFLFLVAPVVIIVVLSFDSAQIVSFPPRQLGLDWYRRFLGSPEWRGSIYVSLEIATLATAISTVGGFFAALSLVRGRYRGKYLIYAVILTPMIVPTVITAIALYMAFARLGIAGSIFATAIGHSVVALPIVTLILSSNLHMLDDGAERAALSLGAGRLYTLWRITLPLARVPLISAALFAFLSSFDELLIALFLSGVRNQTLPVRIWSSLTYSFDPTVTAVSAFFIVLTCLVLGMNGILRQSRPGETR